jgi:hypothetical protein
VERWRRSLERTSAALENRGCSALQGSSQLSFAEIVSKNSKNGQKTSPNSRKVDQK